MKVIVVKTYMQKETGTIVHPGMLLEYTEDRASELIDGGWVDLVKALPDETGLDSVPEIEAESGEKETPVSESEKAEAPEHPLPEKVENPKPGRKKTK